MQIQALSAITAEKISGIFVYLALLIGALPSGKMFLHQLKGFTVNNCLVGIFKDENIFRIILQPFLQLVGFGTFEVSTRAAREGRNPQTGETMTIEASKSPKFKAGKALKDVVNGK